MSHCCVQEIIHFLFPSDYLQQESKDKKGKELDTSGWTLYSKKCSVSPRRTKGESVMKSVFIFVSCHAVLSTNVTPGDRVRR